MSDKVDNPSIATTVAWRFVGFSVVFLPSLFLSPLVAFAVAGYLPAGLGNWLFFWPQTALAYYGFTVPADNVTRTFLDGGPNFVIAAAFWSAVGLGLSWVLRNRSVLATVAAALPVSFIAAWLALLALQLTNIGIYLDGP